MSMRWITLAVVVMSSGLAGEAHAQYGSRMALAEIRASTPDCSANPQNRWIGRVSGATEGQRDEMMPVSFVGCFPDQRSCETWKGKASGIIMTTLIQYSCRPRD